MVSTRDEHPLHVEKNVNISKWVNRILGVDNIQSLSKQQAKIKKNEIEFLTNICELVKKVGYNLSTKYGESCYEQGLHIAEIIKGLGLGVQTIAAGLVYNTYKRCKISEVLNLEHTKQAKEKKENKSAKKIDNDTKNSNIFKELKCENKLSFEKEFIEIENLLDKDIIKLLNNLIQIENAFEKKPINLDEAEILPQTIDNLRKMLINDICDVRGLLLKLAACICDLRFAKFLPTVTQKKIAFESMKIFAPIANRLGVWQIKWEIEDLSFRYLEPDVYKNIAKYLDERRIDRQNYINEIITTLNEKLKANNISAEIFGRVKHIYSIWLKMQRKKVECSQIYDVSAIRVIVDEVTDCYAVLGIVHSIWNHIPKEFDDYIARKKANGYQSLHTAVIDPHGKILEVQIRTKEMHHLAELGVAAHWAYKENSNYDVKVTKQVVNVKKLMKFSENFSFDYEEDNEKYDYCSSLEDETIYAFTPHGDVIDLRKGSTILDFAYKIHTEVGHKCRGAKINGKIVPLNTKVPNGVNVEILTVKAGGPSRDWLNPHLNFITSNRARSKIQHWFKLQDRDKNIVDGKEIINKELKKFGYSSIDIKNIMPHFKKINDEDELYIGLAMGEIRMSQVLSAINNYKSSTTQMVNFVQIKDKHVPVVKSIKHDKSIPTSKVYISGIGNLVYNFAKCCNPLLGDEIIGYITIGGGVSIHKKDCFNVLNSFDKKRNRFIEVFWEGGHRNFYKVHVIIKAYKRKGLLRDITCELSSSQAEIVDISSTTKNENNIIYFHLDLEITGMDMLEAVLTKIQQISNVIDIYRKND